MDKASAGRAGTVKVPVKQPATQRRFTESRERARPQKKSETNVHELVSAPSGKPGALVQAKVIIPVNVLIEEKHEYRTIEINPNLKVFTTVAIIVKEAKMDGDDYALFHPSSSSSINSASTLKSYNLRPGDLLILKKEDKSAAAQKRKETLRKKEKPVLPEKPEKVEKSDKSSEHKSDKKGLLNRFLKARPTADEMVKKDIMQVEQQEELHLKAKIVRKLIRSLIHFEGIDFFPTSLHSKSVT
jgi:hypothetical protein